jgi:site-specific recombinase XerD
MTYIEYLQQQGYSITTIQGVERQAELFIQWCKKQRTTTSEIDYKTTLKYIKYLHAKGNSKKTVNHKLSSLKIYFGYLMQEAYRVDNPLENTVVKGVVRTINHNLLSSDELEDLYYSYPTQNTKDNNHLLSKKRNKMIVGLLVYQGVSTTDLSFLKTEHLHLHKGKLYVPSTSRSNARELELKPWQIMEAIEYINQVRPELQCKYKNNSEDLFISNARFSSVTAGIAQNLKKTNQKFSDVKQLRASVIVNWLKQYNIRKVQYYAGHRYISSTEKYLQDDLENLHEIVNTLHPIR